MVWVLTQIGYCTILLEFPPVFFFQEQAQEVRECVKRGRKPGRKSADKADVKAKLGNITFRIFLLIWFAEHVVLINFKFLKQ